MSFLDALLDAIHEENEKNIIKNDPDLKLEAV